MVALISPAMKSMSNELIDAEHAGEDKSNAATAISSDGMWRPIVGGISRFSLQVPEIALAEARRFEDTSTLFYLSHKVDNGLELHSNSRGSLDLTVTPQETWARYSVHANPNVTYGLGLRSFESSTYPTVSLQYRLVTDELALDSYNLNILENDFRIAMSRTKLSYTETHEDLFHLGISSLTRDTHAAIGRRWFQSLGQFDSVLSLSHFENQSSIEIQVEQNYNNYDFYFGTKAALSGDESELFLGFKANFGASVTTSVASGHKNNTHQTTSLRNLRRVNLDNLWRAADILN